MTYNKPHMPLFPTFPPGLEQSSLTINSAT